MSDTSDSFDERQLLRTKARRVRKTLSCTQCKERKIRCDRKVPGCSSCVARGIHRTCRWGDERDDDAESVGKHDSLPLRRKRAHSSGRLDDNIDDDDPTTSSLNVDSIVEAVMKKLKASKDFSPEGIRRHSKPNPSHTIAAVADSRCSIHECIYVRTSCPPPVPLANTVPVSAFLGGRLFHPVRGIVSPVDEQLNPGVIRASLSLLPRKPVFDRLIDIYLEEVEPHKQIFNRVILREQLDELWHGIDELGIQPCSIASPQAGNTDGNGDGAASKQLIDLSLNLEQHVSTAPSQKYYLCSRARQGLLAVVFAILDSATRSMDVLRLKQLQVVPDTTTSAQASAWCVGLHKKSMEHLNLSNYLQQPTIWSIQTLLMQHGRWLDTPTSDRSLAVVGVAITLAVNMGLNRLGSAFNDLETMPEGRQQTQGSLHPNFPGSSSPLKETFNVATATANATALRPMNPLTDSRYGASLSVFEKGNLALRELGRKLWCCLLWTDWIMAGHLDHFYSAHDSINHTAPPAPVDDEDIVSTSAPFALAKARMGIHRPSENESIGLRVALARAARVQTDLENAKGYTMSYEDVLMIDEGFREVIDMVPNCLEIMEHRMNVPDKHVFRTTSTTARERRMQLQAIMLQDQIHFRRLRLHRMHFGKGLKDARFRPSVMACLQAARVILAGRTQVEEESMRVGSTFMLQSHLFHAALVFQLILLYEMDRTRAVSSGNDICNDDRIDDDNEDANDNDAYVLDDFDATLQQLDTAVSYLQNSEQAHFSRDLLPGLAAFLVGVREYNDRHKAAKAKVTRRFASDGGKSNRRVQDQPRAKRPISHPSRNDDANDALQGPCPDSHANAATILASIPMLDAQDAHWPRTASKRLPCLNPHFVSTSNDHTGGAPTPSTSMSSASPQTIPWPVVAPFGSSHHLQGSASQTQQQQQYNATTSFIGNSLSEQSAHPSDAVVATSSAVEAYDPSIWSLEALFPDYAAGELDLFAALERSFFGGATNTSVTVQQTDSIPSGAVSALYMSQQSATPWLTGTRSF